MTVHTHRPPTLRTSSQRYGWLAFAILLIAVGVTGWLWAAPPGPPNVPTSPTATSALVPGTTATMDSASFHYSPGWTVTARGADPGEPAHPWTEPAGVITFTYTGADLLLQLALGDYWGYLYATVDGMPANQLTMMGDNLNHQGQQAGYLTFYAPELLGETGPTPQWVLVHRAPDSNQSHDVRIEIWRGWSQTPLRGVAVDAQIPPGLPRWPFAALLALGVALFLLSLHNIGFVATKLPAAIPLSDLLTWLTRPISEPSSRLILGLIGLLLVAAAISQRIWWLGPMGLTLLGYASLRQPALWTAALLFALPFYYSQTLPILPNRATNLIDVGVFGGLLVAIGAWLIEVRTVSAYLHTGSSRPTFLWIIALTGWSFIAAGAAIYPDVALREWRTVFLAAALFALLLYACRADRNAPRLLLLAWIAGGVAIALIGLVHFATDAMLIEAEGVHRVRSLYGSPNNLALYLERTLMPTLALLLLLPTGTQRWIALAATGIQGSVLLLTFSKGALLLGLPAGFLTLWLGGLYLLRRHHASTRPLWWLAFVACMALLALLPFLGTERFQRLLNFNTGTGFIRLHLWRSSLQMALDYPWLGVGPDNFLYAYRSHYILPTAWQEADLNHPHTWLLDWWTRLGVVGMVLGLGWWITGLRATWQRLQQAPQSTAALWLGTLAAMIASLAHGTIDLSYAVPDLMLIWVLLTMLPDMTMPDKTVADISQQEPSQKSQP